MSLPQYVDRRELRTGINPIVAQLHRVIATGTEDHDLVGGPDNAAIDANAETVCPVRGTIRNLRVRVTANTANTNSSVTLRKNGVDSALSAVILTLTNGTFSDLVDSVDVEPGDLLLMRVVVGGAAQTIKLHGWSLVLEPRGL